MQSTQRLALQTIILYELSNHQRNKKDFVISGLSQNSIYLNSLESNSEHHEPFPRQVFGASFQPTIFPKKKGAPLIRGRIVKDELSNLSFQVTGLGLGRNMQLQSPAWV